LVQPDGTSQVLEASVDDDVDVGASHKIAHPSGAASFEQPSGTTQVLVDAAEDDVGVGARVAVDEELKSDSPPQTTLLLE
jgi:hypothetical protein